MRWSSFLRILFALFAVELAVFGVFFRAPTAPARPPRGAPPVPDSDGDGIPDATDACPREAEDLDAFADDDGCPDLDNDGDEVVDAADDCANEPNSLRSDGCPGAVCRGPFPAMALPQIPKRIYFEYRAAEIKAGWFPVLDAVAAKIKGDPARFPVVEIVGAIASAEAGSLASARAQAVRAALVARGVPGERLKVTPSTGGAGVPKVSFRVPRPGPQPGAVPDADGDGITDPWDACPRKPEVFNGFWDEDGCPDIDIDDRPMRYSLDPIYFARNSDDPSPPSDDWLDDMANLLMARPYIRRLDIFGVASSDERDPGRLAAARARAVERHLTYYGVEPERLQVRTESWRSLRVADGKRSRDRDRRVEFVWASVADDDVPIEVTAEVWQPTAPAFAVGGLSLPDLDMRAWPAEVQTAWRERKKDPPAAAAVFERARGRLDAGGWLALAEIRYDLAMAEHAKQADDPWFDAFTTLDAYARVEQLDPGGATAAIARYYTAEILADRVPEKADRMFREVVTSKAPVKFRIAALLQVGAAAFAAHRWSEAADRLGGGIALSRARPGSFGSMDAPAWLQASALYRARRYREALALVEREVAAFPPGDEREKMLDLAAAALEALGSAAPAAASARFGPRLDAIRREDGAAERDVGKVTAAIVARCVRATATPCEATSSIFGGVPSCGVLTLEVRSGARGGVRTEVLDRGSFTDTRRSFLACLDGTHPAVYGSGLPRAPRARANVRVTNR